MRRAGVLLFLVIPLPKEGLCAFSTRYILYRPENGYKGEAKVLVFDEITITAGNSGSRER
jgi:hypothetical protein